MAESARDCTEKVSIEEIVAKPGSQWSPDDKVKVACWLAREQMVPYLTIGLLRLGDMKDAESAFHNFVMKVEVRGFPKFNPEGNASSYFKGAWRNHLTNCRRRHARRARREQQMPHDEEGKPLFEAVDRQLPVPTLVDLKQRLESLPDEQRIVILQRHYDGNGRLKPFKGIAAERGKSVDAVKKDYYRGIKTLRRQADYEERRTTVIETVPPDEEYRRASSDDDTATDRETRQTKPEALP